MLNLNKNLPKNSKVLLSNNSIWIEVEEEHHWIN
jgi:hypothetical protein